MAQAILAYTDDPELAKTTGAQARRYAEQTFDISNIASRFERLFERLISGPPRRH
jgi:glycosyltransferase involved in cell wall biosynthesis